MGADSNDPLQIAQGNVRVRTALRVSAVHEFVEQGPEIAPFVCREVGTGSRFVIRDAPPQRVQHPYAGRRERKRVTARVAARVPPFHESGLHRSRDRRADRGALQSHAAGEHRLTDARTRGERRHHADDRRCDFAVSHLPAERRHDTVIGDVQIQSEHRLPVETELGLNQRGRREIVGR
jgi:hypothetical protein